MQKGGLFSGRHGSANKYFNPQCAVLFELSLSGALSGVLTTINRCERNYKSFLSFICFHIYGFCGVRCCTPLPKMALLILFLIPRMHLLKSLTLRNILHVFFCRPSWMGVILRVSMTYLIHLAILFTAQIPQ